jgi:hypothetical protein
MAFDSDGIRTFMFHQAFGLKEKMRGWIQCGVDVDNVHPS